MFLLYSRAAQSQGHLAMAKNKWRDNCPWGQNRCCGTDQSLPGQLYYSCPEQSRLTADPQRLMTDGQVREPSNGPDDGESFYTTYIQLMVLSKVIAHKYS